LLFKYLAVVASSEAAVCVLSGLLRSSVRMIPSCKMVSFQFRDNSILLQDTEELAFLSRSDFRAHKNIYGTLKRNVFVCLSACLPACLSVCLSACLSEKSSDLRIVSRGVIRLCDTS
jgi:hypothetical protein